MLALKSDFRKNPVPNIISNLVCCGSSSAGYPKIIVLGAILLIHHACIKLTKKTIFYYSKHTEFVRSTVEFTITTTICLSIWTRAIDNQLSETNKDFEQYVCVDHSVATCEQGLRKYCAKNSNKHTKSEPEKFI